MKNKLLLSLSLLLVPFLLIAQQKVKIEKSEYELEKEGFEEAWYNIRLGNKAYEKGGGLYQVAAKHYLLAFKFNPENAELNYKLGVCSLFGDDKQGALPYFLKARSLNMDVSEDIVLLTGRAYQFRGDYGKAIDFYNMYADKVIDNGKLDPIVTTYINECNFAIESGEVSGKVEVTNLGTSINSNADDYSSVMAKEEQLMYFTTRRQLLEKDELQRADMKWNENIYLATRNGDGWSAAGPAGKEIATPMNEGVLYVDNENTFMLIYSGWIGSGDIQISEFDRGEWTSPESYKDETSTPSRETSISITSDGGEIFFTSDRKKGSFGGRDIYSIKHIKKDKWTKPMNLGVHVNTEGNEEAVWASETGDTIWFSSNGHKGFGAYDVFMSVRDDNGSYTEAVNLGMPVNSQWNDIFYRPSLIDRREAHFSSNRPGGSGGLDIYKSRVKSTFELKTDTLNTNYLPFN